MNITSQLDAIQRRLNRIQLFSDPPTLTMVTISAGEAIPADTNEWGLICQIELPSNPAKGAGLEFLEVSNSYQGTC